MSDRLRVIVASPLDEELCALIEEREPRVSVIRDHSLLPTQRHGGDHQGDPSFTRTAEQQQKFDALVDSADALYGLPDESATALARTITANPTLRWVHTTPAGGGAQVRAAKLGEDDLNRILFTQSAGVHAEPLAEFALLGVLAGLKQLPRLQAAQAENRWADRWTMGLISEQTILVVGLGSIGKAVAQKLSLLGATVIGVHRREVDAPGVTKIVPVDDFADAAASADAIIMTLPGTAATNKMLSSTVLAAVRPGVTVVNVGRGTTIDEDALVVALGDGRVGYAALDVFATEPLSESSPLWGMPNVLVSPHTSALHPNEDRLIAELFADNATRLLDGRPLINRVNTVEFY
ncbi:MAG TPA: D-2-hydroxyacid dehydrogenase [Glaciihabitans sp.]|nr:D-2-hydroxyacid dehydrogenase [Glaciihabitans sp.]